MKQLLSLILFAYLLLISDTNAFRWEGKEGSSSLSKILETIHDCLKEGKGFSCFVEEDEEEDLEISQLIPSPARSRIKSAVKSDRRRLLGFSSGYSDYVEVVADECAPPVSASGTDVTGFTINYYGDFVGLGASSSPQTSESFDSSEKEDCSDGPAVLYYNPLNRCTLESESTGNSESKFLAYYADFVSSGDSDDEAQSSGTAGVSETKEGSVDSVLSLYAKVISIRNSESKNVPAEEGDSEDQGDLVDEGDSAQESDPNDD